MSARSALMEDIVYAASSRDHAVLLLHGLCSTPQEMGYLARALARQGFAVRAPYVSGYGLGTDCTSSAKWREEVRECYEQLAATYKYVSVAGLCIGATLALALAVEVPNLTAISLLSVTLNYDGWTIPWYHWMLNIAYRTPIRHIYSLKEQHPYGLKNAALRAKVEKSMRTQGDSEIGNASLSMQYIYEAKMLARYVTLNLSAVEADCLIIHAIDDDISSTANAEIVFSKIGASQRRRIFLDDCYHIITMDNERDLVARETQYFFEEAAERRASLTNPLQAIGKAHTQNPAND
jgi:carboxylesterase